MTADTHRRELRAERRLGGLGPCRSAAFVCATLALLAALCRPAAAEPAPPSRQPHPNVVFILADDLGYAELGCYGQRKIRTPNLDRMAAEGMRFTQFYSGSPVCAPARCSLLTGKHGGHAFVRNNHEAPPRGEFRGQMPLPDGTITIGHLLQRQGYTTAAIGKWGLGYVGSTGDPNRQGFDLFYGYNCQRHAHNHYPRYLWRNDRQEVLDGNDHGLTGKRHSHDEMEREALEFIRRHRDRPFFLYLPFAIPHVALQVPDDSLAEYRGLWDDPPYEGGRGYLPHPTPRAAYAAMVTRMDRSVGRIVALLKELGLDERTLVIFTSDNGPTHGGVGGSDSEFFESAGPLRGQKGQVYEGGIRVPMIARWPGRIRAGSRSDHVSYFPDVLPTLAELAGVADRAAEGIDGISFADTLFGRPSDQRRHEWLFWEFAGYGGQQAVRKGNWKAVRRDMQRGNLRIELYDLAADIGESRDLAGERPDVVAEMERIMRTGRTPSAEFPLQTLDAPR
jgi:arylsulfatase A